MTVFARILSTVGVMTAAILAASSATAQSSAYVTQISEARSTASGAVAERSTSLSQRGDGNIVSIDQAATANAAARVGQNGNANRAAVTQTGATAAVADLGQTGDRNDATVRQGAGVNVAILRQLGNDNRLTAIQVGLPADTINSMIVSQMGNDNIANLVQNGAGNNLSLTQTGNKTADITQNGNSTVTVNQLGTRPDSISIDLAPNMSMAIDRYAGAAAQRGGQ